MTDKNNSLENNILGYERILKLLGSMSNNVGDNLNQ